MKSRFLTALAIVAALGAAAWAAGENRFKHSAIFEQAVTFQAASTFENTVALQGDVSLTDSDGVIFGTGSDVDISWDGTNLIIAAAADDSLIEIADSAATQKSFDVKWYGGEASGASYLYADASLKFLLTEDIDIKLNDSDDLIFGDGADAAAVAGDAKIRWDGTDLDLLCTANNTIFKIGDGTTSFDLWVFGASSAAYWSWDASANDLKAEDSVSLMFGTGAAAGPGTAGDVEMRWDGTDFDILGAADDLILNVGNGTNSFDLNVFGEAATDKLTWDASAGLLSCTGTAMIAPKLKLTAKTADYFVTGADFGQVFTTTGAGGTVIFNLPEPAAAFAGCTVTLINTVAQTMTVRVNGGVADKIITFNDLDADSASLQTGAELIGGAFYCICNGTVWIVIPWTEETQTVTVVS